MMRLVLLFLLFGSLTQASLPGRVRLTNTLTPLNRETRVTYDTRGLVSTVREPSGQLATNFYNAKGELFYTVRDANRNGVADLASTNELVTSTRTWVTTDANNLPVRRTQVSVTANSNDATLVVISTQDVSLDGWHAQEVAYGRTNRTDTYQFGDERNVVATAPDGTLTTSAYYAGRLGAVTVDASDLDLGLLRYVTYGYDAHGLPSTTTDHRVGTVTTRLYDPADRVHQLITAAGTNTYDYDGLGRLYRTRFPDHKLAYQFYHANGLPSSQSGARVQPAKFGYDAQGRLTTLATYTNYAASEETVTTRWVYEPYRGLLTAKLYANQTSNTWAYTNSGRLVLRANARGQTARYGYDANGELSAVTYANATNTPNLAFTRDRLGRTTRVLQGTNATGGTNAYTYHLSGLVLTESRHHPGFGSKLTLTNVYDPLLRRTHLALAFDAFGSFFHNAFAYDAASRLTTVSHGSLSAAYGYVPGSALVGSITQHDAGAVRLLTVRSYDALDRLQSVLHFPGATAPPTASFGYSYNAAGQRDRVSLGDDGPYGSRWDYAYDFLGQVTAGKRSWLDAADGATPVAG